MYVGPVLRRRFEFPTPFLGGRTVELCTSKLNVLEISLHLQQVALSEISFDVATDVLRAKLPRSTCTRRKIIAQR